MGMMDSILNKLARFGYRHSAVEWMAFQACNAALVIVWTLLADHPIATVFGMVVCFIGGIGFMASLARWWHERGE